MAKAPQTSTSHSEGEKPKRKNRIEPPKFETREGRAEVQQARRSAEGSERAKRPRLA